jgi:adenine phosphoribosyltransferase|tara:strand:- start:32 stop:556 length:525 start_codon:yes stop_codon:yes gene_type:complete
LDNNIRKHIREVIDFPKKGISYKDITPLLMDVNVSNYITSELIDRISHLKIDAIVGIESRGFLYGFLLANRIGVPFVPIRKVGKLPSKTIKYKYDLEYGSAEIEIHANDIKSDWNVLIHDDLLATGGTACAAAELIKMANANVAGFAFLINLTYLKPHEKLNLYSDNIISLVDY